LVSPAKPVIVFPHPSVSGKATVDDQQQQNHDRDLKIARNEAKREFFSDVRLSTCATSIAIVLALGAFVFYLVRK
jgi:hypothetical protein